MPNQIDLFRGNYNVNGMGGGLQINPLNYVKSPPNLDIDQNGVAAFLNVLEQATGINLNATNQTALNSSTNWVALFDNAAVTDINDFVTWINGIDASANAAISIASTALTNAMQALNNWVVMLESDFINGISDFTTWIQNALTTLFGPTNVVGALTLVENDIANFLSNAISGGNAPTSPNSAVAFLDNLLGINGIPHTNVMIPPNPGSGTITHDASASATPFTGFPNSTVNLGPWNITPGATANFLTVRIGFFASGTTYNIVTCNGAQMSLLETVSSISGNVVTQIYGIPNPTTGSANSIAVNLNCPFGSISIATATADTYIGVGSIGTTLGNANVNSSPSLVLTSTAGEYVIHAATVESNASPETLTVTSPAGYTTQYNSGSIGGAIQIASLAGDAAGATIVTFSDTAGYTASNQWTSAAVNLVPLSSSPLGSGFRAANTSTATVSSTTGNNLFPTTFFNTTTMITEGTFSSGVYTVGHDGWYTVTIAALLVAGYVSQFVGLNLTQNASSPKRGHTSWIGGSGSTTVCAHTFQIYCAVNDTLKPGYFVSFGSASTFTGTADGLSSYFEVSLNNRGLLS